jgi:hypothetical protein
MRVCWSDTPSAKEKSMRITRRMLAVLTLVSSTAMASGAAEAPSERPLAIPPDDPAIAWSPCPALFPEGCQLAVLHGDPAKPNADLFLRVPGGALLPPHSHTSAERMILVAGRMDVHFKGHPKQTLARGDYAYGPAGLPHLARCVSQEPCTLFIAFEQPVDVLPHEGPIS